MGNGGERQVQANRLPIYMFVICLRTLCNCLHAAPTNKPFDRNFETFLTFLNGFLYTYSSALLSFVFEREPKPASLERWARRKN